jgi:hypothetical protein
LVFAHILADRIAETGMVGSWSSFIPSFGQLKTNQTMGDPFIEAIEAELSRDLDAGEKPAEPAPPGAVDAPGGG